MRRQAFDGRDDTKWLSFGAKSGCSWLEYRLPVSVPPVTFLRYSLTSANDFPERDPCEWLLLGALEEPPSCSSLPGDWEIVDRQTDVVFPSRHTTLEFNISQPAPCRCFPAPWLVCVWTTNCVHCGWLCCCFC